MCLGRDGDRDRGRDRGMGGMVMGIGIGIGIGIGTGSPSWFTRSVLQHLFKSQGRGIFLAASSSKQQASKQQAASKQLSSFLPIRISQSS